jgi:beta-N-acetylhexosaminidase
MLKRILRLAAVTLTVTLSLGFLANPANARIAPEPLVDANHPENWTDEALAAQTIFICSSAPNLKNVAKYVRRGLGGVALVGTGASPNLKSQVNYLKTQARNGITPVIASDEEGGDVQRLRRAIYTLPSATTMGGWSDARVRKTAFEYGKRMKALGVDIAFSPVADLNVPGFFIAQSRRGFSSKPSAAGRKALAWAEGLKDADVLPVIKHWPGHGRAVDTHAKPGVVPSLEELQNSDLIPFNYAFERGITAVMVGHLIVPGLTEPKTPTSRSKAALALLREQVGPEGLIITDSLSMGGATKGLKGDIAEAAIRSLETGVDVALVCSGPSSLITRVTEAVTSGRLPRAMMIEKVKRILAYKRDLGVIIEK